MLPSSPERPVADDLAALNVLARAPLPRRGRSLEGARVGAHTGTQRGRGLDFLELRPWQPCDDVRDIDWRHSARHGVPSTKVFRTERDRVLRLLVDLGGSMRFGTRVAFKSVVAARAATALAWQAAAAGDRIAALVGQSEWADLPPQARRVGVMALIHALSARQDVEAEALLAAGLQRLAATVGTGDRVVLFSDFRRLDAAACSALIRIGRRAECLLVHVHDPFEAEVPPPLRVALTDGASNLLVDFADPTVRERHVAAFAAHCAMLETLAHSARARLMRMPTTMPPETFLAAVAH